MNEKWERVAFCSECEQELSSDEEMYSHGICPYCGHNSDSTICETRVRSARWVWGKRSWWQRLLGTGKGHWEFRS